MTAAEAAAFLGGGITARTVLEKAARRELPCHRFGRKMVRFLRSELMACSQSRRD